MTLVNIDLRNQGYETGPDDRVVFYSLLVREGDFGTISTAPVEVPLVDGKGSKDLAPGPVGVQIIAGQIVDTRVKIGEVPPSGPTTLNAVMMVTPAYTPALQAQFLKAIQNAQAAALGEIGNEVAVAVNTEMGAIDTRSQEALIRSQSAENAATGASSKATSALSDASNAVSRVNALEAMAGLSPESPADGQTANLVLQEDTLAHGAVKSTAMKAVFEALPEYIVGPTGHYATVDDFLIDHPEGRARVLLQPGDHYVSRLPGDGQLQDFALIGQGSEFRGRKPEFNSVTNVFVSGPLIEDIYNPNPANAVDLTKVNRNITFSNFNLRNTTSTNADNGIHLGYAIGAVVEKLNIQGFGGSSIWLDGAVNCAIRENYVIASDAGSNGFAGIRISARAGKAYAESATTVHTKRNYVGIAREYGFHFTGCTHGVISDGDIAEWSPVGFYFQSAPITVISPYTENCTIGIKSLDTNPLIIGRVRDELIQEWSANAVNIADRGAARITDRWVDAGTGLLFGAADGHTPGDFTSTISIRSGTNAPNGNRTAPAGSLFFQRGAPYGRNLWQKRTSSGNTGWLPIGNATVVTSEMGDATSWLNMNKYKGYVVFNENTMMMYYASGATPTSSWIAVHDRTTTIVPA